MWLDKLKEMKKKSGKTSKEISEITGISKSTIDKLFSGKTKEPYLKSTRSIVHAMGFTLDDLDDTPQKPETIDIQKEQLIKNYALLNEQGKSKLVEYSDDLLTSGKYAQEEKEKRA